jgi:hypothetical protein
MSDPIPTGQPVKYHGTQAYHHGTATVLDAVPEWDTCSPANRSVDGFRYQILSVHGEIISQVRRQSFTLPDTGAEATRRAHIRALMDDLPTPSADALPARLGFDRAEAEAFRFMGKLFAGNDNDCEGR